MEYRSAKHVFCILKEGGGGYKVVVAMFLILKYLKNVPVSVRVPYL